MRQFNNRRKPSVSVEEAKSKPVDEQAEQSAEKLTVKFAKNRQQQNSQLQTKEKIVKEVISWIS